MHGPSRTTVEKVVALADLSPGIVRFYFDSKDAMLVASLAYLAAEFEERVMVPVAQLKDTPVAALERLVELYLDPEIASPRKVSVWYSFWGEASSRQEYYDICGRKDEDFAALVRDLVARVIALTGEDHLDTEGIALGLMGALEVLWQGIAFQSEVDIDRTAARAQCMAFLRSVFPGQFGAVAAGAAGASGAAGAGGVASGVSAAGVGGVTSGVGAAGVGGVASGAGAAGVGGVTSGAGAAGVGGVASGVGAAGVGGVTSGVGAAGAGAEAQGGASGSVAGAGARAAGAGASGPGGAVGGGAVAGAGASGAAGLASGRADAFGAGGVAGGARASAAGGAAGGGGAIGAGGVGGVGGRSGAVGLVRRGPSGIARYLPASAYFDATLLTAERERLFRPAWQVIGHEAEVPAAGDFLTGDLASERALVVRDAKGNLRAFRNACRRRPHALVSVRTGHFTDAIPCVPHGLEYGFDGKLLDGATDGDLTPLEIKQKSGLILVRAAGVARESGGPVLTGWDEFAALAPAGVQELDVAADWKVLVEQWLEGSPSRGRFLAPNQLVEIWQGGAAVLRVLPVAPGRSRLQRLDYAPAKDVAKRGARRGGQAGEDRMAGAQVGPGQRGGEAHARVGGQSVGDASVRGTAWSGAGAGRGRAGVHSVGDAGRQSAGQRSASDPSARGAARSATDAGRQNAGRQSARDAQAGAAARSGASGRDRATGRQSRVVDTTPPEAGDLLDKWVAQQVELAESTQTGLASAGHDSAENGPVSAALAEFRGSIAVLLPHLAADSPATGS